MTKNTKLKSFNYTKVGNPAGYVISLLDNKGTKRKFKWNMEISKRLDELSLLVFSTKDVGTDTVPKLTVSLRESEELSHARVTRDEVPEPIYE